MVLHSNHDADDASDSDCDNQSASVWPIGAMQMN